MMTKKPIPIQDKKRASQASTSTPVQASQMALGPRLTQYARYDGILTKKSLPDPSKDPDVDWLTGEGHTLQEYSPIRQEDFGDKLRTAVGEDEGVMDGIHTEMAREQSEREQFFRTPTRKRR